MSMLSFYLPLYTYSHIFDCHFSVVQCFLYYILYTGVLYSSLHVPLIFFFFSLAKIASKFPYCNVIDKWKN